MFTQCPGIFHTHLWRDEPGLRESFGVQVKGSSLGSGCWERGGVESWSEKWSWQRKSRGSVVASVSKNRTASSSCQSWIHSQRLHGTPHWPLLEQSPMCAACAPTPFSSQVLLVPTFPHGLLYFCLHVSVLQSWDRNWEKGDLGSCLLWKIIMG